MNTDKMQVVLKAEDKVSPALAKVAHSLTLLAIDVMPAGREMDELIAKIMGLKTCTCKGLPLLGGFDPIHCMACGGAACPNYSSNIAAAWEVVEWLLETGRYFTISPHCFYKPPAWLIYLDTVPEVRGETFPLAICRAALKAVEVQQRR